MIILQEMYEAATRQPVRLRNRIIHGYRTVDLQIVHTTAETQLPGFAEAVRGVIVALESE